MSTVILLIDKHEQGKIIPSGTELTILIILGDYGVSVTHPDLREPMVLTAEYPKEYKYSDEEIEE